MKRTISILILALIFGSTAFAGKVITKTEIIKTYLRFQVPEMLRGDLCSIFQGASFESGFTF